jgi:hypothetical protein
MNKGFKSFGKIPYAGVQHGKTLKSYPKNPMRSGLKGFPINEKFHNPYKVQIGPNPPYSTVQKSQLRILSDSVGLGSAAEPLSNGYMNRLDEAYPQFTDIINYSENGQGVWRMCQIIQTASWTSGADNLAWIIINIGLNDIARSGESNPDFFKTLRKIRNGLFSMMLRPLQSTVIASGDTSITRVNITGSYFFNTIGGRFVQGAGLPGADRASYSTTAGATWTWTTPSCRHFYVQLGGACGGTPLAYLFGICTITVDGTVMATYNGNDQYDGVTDGAYDNGRGPVCVAIWDLPLGVHTVVVTHVSGNATAVDFFSTITDNMRICPAFTVCEIPYINRQGYYGQPPNSLRGNRNDSNKADQIIRELVIFFRSRGYNYGYCPVNDFYSLANCSSDNVHPTTRGHAQLLQAVLCKATKSFNNFQWQL